MLVDKTCKIMLFNVQGWVLDETMLLAVMRRVARLASSAEAIDIYPQERVPDDAPPYKHPGSCEWMMRVTYVHSTYAITIGCLQRSPTSEVEFHS